jgi:hypothetical protein
MINKSYNRVLKTSAGHVDLIFCCLCHTATLLIAFAKFLCVTANIIPTEQIGLFAATPICWIWHEQLAVSAVPIINYMFSFVYYNLVIWIFKSGPTIILICANVLLFRFL